MMTRSARKRSVSLVAVAASAFLVSLCARAVRAEPWEDETPETDGAELAEDPAAGTAPDADVDSTTALPAAYLTLGAGLTQRALAFEAADGRHELDTGLVPALGLSVHAGLERPSWFCHVDLGYRSSVFATAIQTPPMQGAPELRTTLQTHGVWGGVAPGLRFAGLGEASLALFAGYGVRALGSVQPLLIPRFTLHGPLLRLSFELPLFDARVHVRLSPELQWIISQTYELRELARTERHGLSYGAEANVRVQLWTALSLQLTYREAHARITSAWQTPFEDLVRYLLIEAFVHYF